MLLKQLFSAAAIAITFIAFYPYIRLIFQNAVKPHVFSWVIWGTTTFIVFLAQLEDGAGVGAWPIGISAIITLFIAYMAFIKRTDIAITKTDWLFFIIAMSSIPFWYVTSDPLWAVIILTIVDILGFGPTIRKIHAQPYSESLMFFSLFLTRNLLVIAALESYSLTTVLFPAIIALACMLLNITIMYRRSVLASTK